MAASVRLIRLAGFAERIRSSATAFIPGVRERR
jgi:hypothetical protein